MINLINKISLYIKQLRLYDACCLLMSEACRKIFGSDSRISYSQLGEDLVINWYCANPNGFYVEVGSNHPKRNSNTYSLYTKGWSGICIDANENLVKKHARQRRNDTCVVAAVSDIEHEIVFTEFDDSLVSSLDNDHVSEWSKARSIKRKTRMQSKRLDTILRENNAPARFDLLSVDVEGHDYQVIRSLDLEFYRPDLIVVEMHGFDINNPSLNETYKHLLTMDYRMVGYLVMNGYFVSNRIG